MQSLEELTRSPTVLHNCGDQSQALARKNHRINAHEKTMNQRATQAFMRRHV
jgi:hypothetical protein